MPEGVGYDTLEPEKQPSAPVNQPSSGTYGERAAVDRLRQSLPSSGATDGRPAGPASGTSGPAPAAPVPVPNEAGARTGAPSGVPEVLLGPSQSSRPVGSLLDQAPVNPVAAATNGQQQRLALLDQLSQDQTVSEETRQWAAVMVRRLSAGA